MLLWAVFPHGKRWHIQHPLADVPVRPLPGTQGLLVATLSPESTARPDLAEKSSASFRSDLHPGDAAALGGAGAD